MSHHKPVHLLEAKLKHQNSLKKWGPTWEIKTLSEFSLTTLCWLIFPGSEAGFDYSMDPKVLFSMPV